jgi:arylformamidase
MQPKQTPAPTDLIDISPEISVSTPVWPGDQPLVVRWTQRLAEGNSANLSAITLTPHLGAHVDSPLHLFDGESDVGDLDLEPFIGPATLLDLSGTEAVTGIDLAEIDLAEAGRLLLRTRPPRTDDSAEAEPAHIAVDAAELIAAAGIPLVGIDTPSVDSAAASDLPVHRLLTRAGVAILEGLDLSAAAAGRYELIALPLRLLGVEASPVRALLRPLSESR